MNTYKLHDSQDHIGFGQMSGERFSWIYRLNYSYFEWIIKETDICFTDLRIFYFFGKPLELKNENFSTEKSNLIFDIASANGVNSSSGAFLINISILDILFNKKIITNNDFKFIDFKFSPEIIEINYNKLKILKRKTILD